MRTLERYAGRSRPVRREDDPRATQEAPVKRTTTLLLSLAVCATALEASAQTTVSMVTLVQAQAAATAANLACQRQGFATTTTVVDPSGSVVAQLRMDGATAAT